MQLIYSAVSKSLKDGVSLLICVLSAIISFAIFIALPVFTVPGNTLFYQLKIFRVQDYFLMISLAILIGLNFALQAYGMRQQRMSANRATKSVAGGMMSGIIGMFGAMVGTATCASCLAFLFGLIGLGAGTVFFVLQNQVYFLSGSVLAMFVSLYFASRKVNKICDSC